MARFHRMLVLVLLLAGCSGGGRTTTPLQEERPASFFTPAPMGSSMLDVLARSAGASADGPGATGASGKPAASGTPASTAAASNGVPPSGPGSKPGATAGGSSARAGCPVTAVTQGYGRLKVTLQGDVLFAFDKHVLKPAALTMLATIKRDIIDKHPKAKLVVEGHTDSAGNDSYNRALSKRRAGAVAGWLVAKGIARERITRPGYGERYPRAPNDTKANRAKNRRVGKTQPMDGWGAGISKQNLSSMGEC